MPLYFRRLKGVTLFPVVVWQFLLAPLAAGDIWPAAATPSRKASASRIPVAASLQEATPPAVTPVPVTSVWAVMPSASRNVPSKLVTAVAPAAFTRDRWRQGFLLEGRDRSPSKPP